MPVRVRAPIPPAASITFAMPKSRIFATSLAWTITFSGFKSRCTMPCACAAPTPARAPWTMGMARTGGRGRPGGRDHVERLPLEPLHHEVRAAVLGHVDLERVDDVRVQEAHAGATLFDEAAAHLLVDEVLGAYNLDRDPGRDARRRGEHVRLVDDPHAALPEQRPSAESDPSARSRRARGALSSTAMVTADTLASGHEARSAGIAVLIGTFVVLVTLNSWWRVKEVGRRARVAAQYEATLHDAGGEGGEDD